MKNRRNYYRILHVQPDAPREVIRSSYRTIMHKMRTHPDLGGDQASAALINEAYEVLSNAEQRAAYDHMRQDLSWWRIAANEPEPDLAQAEGQSASDASANQAIDNCEFCGCLLRFEQPEAGMTNFCPTCDSPLAPPAEIAAQDADRRTIERVPKHLPIEFWTDWPQAVPHDASAHDLSLSGLRFSSQLPLASGQILKIDSSAFKAIARVVRCGQVGAEWEAGAHFLSLSFTRSRGSFIRERV